MWKSENENGHSQTVLVPFKKAIIGLISNQNYRMKIFIPQRDSSRIEYCLK